MNEMLKRHHAKVYKQEQAELAVIFGVSLGISSVFVGFGIISIITGA